MAASLLTALPTHRGLEKQMTSMAAVAAQTPSSAPPQVPRTISELISIRAKQKPNQPILGYPSQGIEYVEYTFAQLDRFTNAGASQLARDLPLRQSSTEKQCVVAILGPSTLDYFVTILALSRLGFTVLFLSTRISEPAYVSLLDSTGCSQILIDSSFQKTVANVRKHVPALQVGNILSKEQYAVHEDVLLETAQGLDLSMENEVNSWIIHSSGSTGLPKPIFQTHRAALRNYESSMHMEGFITLPLYHAHGISSVFRGITAYKKIFMYNAGLPLTSPNLLNIMRRHKFQIFYGVPYALKLLSETAEGIEALAAMEIVMFGGSACPDVLGDRLAEAGVNLISHYGTTETGQLMTSLRPKGDKAWNYVRVHDKLAPFARFEDRGGNLFELVVLEGWPSKVATNRDDGAYATKDLFEPHPTIDRAWKFAGRLDDTIVLVNGEKVIPLATEGVVRQKTLVQEAVMFGAGKSQLGMMIIPSQSAAEVSEAKILDAVWPAIEKENQNSPAYAQLAREAIVVLPVGIAYPQTDKGTLIRAAFYKAMSEEIEQLYARLDQNASSGTRILDVVGTRNFLRDVVLKIVLGLTPADVTDTTDLFSLGVDSLQSTRLRAAILQELDLNGGILSQNFVFDNPTLSKMADAIISIREGRQTASENVEDEMACLVSKYAAHFPQHVPQPRASSRRCVIVTGATGSLGAHIVSKLAARVEEVDEVCCLVRASSERSARQRILASLKHRALLHSLPLVARRKITAYPVDFSDPRLGLSEGTYERLTYDLTHVIHCAWSVNFNKQLSSFEADCIAGTKNLVLLCLAAKQPNPASLNFCSSVSTVAKTPHPVVAEALPERYSWAQGMGYAQSKLVTEHLCARATAATGMRARVLRVGQIVADTLHGIWNDTEAIPLMLQAATTIGVLPALDESPRWLPVDNVAQTVLDISFSSSSSSQAFFNVVNPATFHWTRHLLASLRASGLLSFEQVDQREWIRRLRASNPDPVTNPTIKLVEFFASKYDHDHQKAPKRSALAYETAATESLSPTIASRPKTGKDVAFVSKFISYFLATSWAAPSPYTTAPATTTPPRRRLRNVRLIVLAGPCGSGKSTFASLLADRLQSKSRNGAGSVHVIEGDSLHDSIAITKMSTATPLCVIDREIWLSRLRIQVLERIRAAEMMPCSTTQTSSEPTMTTTMTILLTCSALKRSYRDSLRRILTAVDKDHPTTGRTVFRTDFVLLEATEDELVRRVAARKGHYMKSSMVRSQMETQEGVAAESEADVVPVDSEMEMGELVEEVAALLAL
ncbi:hypothetical protein AJ79_01929 [Helicocarpus griseus UAMH5409]|uniref:gluconokinase n=1 Tax=Helicocarpus griseus UAMH5409 TaxID=1447875 RepID=A0A2B7Y5L9_9EURO|nr:hypothetical protein AJ79_01929 [Helicocarpus griseus UAMH5409]